MDGFAPAQNTRSTSAAFMGFVKGITGDTRPSSVRAAGVPLDVVPANASNTLAVPIANPVGEFASQWGLDACATEALMSLDPDTQSRVIGGFCAARKRHPESVCCV